MTERVCEADQSLCQRRRRKETRVSRESFWFMGVNVFNLSAKWIWEVEGIQNKFVKDRNICRFSLDVTKRSRGNTQTGNPWKFVFCYPEALWFSFMRTDGNKKLEGNERNIWTSCWVVRSLWLWASAPTNSEEICVVSYTQLTSIQMWTEDVWTRRAQRE